MGVRDVARIDLEDCLRSRRLWLGSVGYLAVTALVLFALRRLDDPHHSFALFGTAFASWALVALLALSTTAIGIAGRREEDCIGVLTSVASSPRDLVLGTFLSRSLLLCGVLTAGVVFGFGVATRWYSTVEPPAFLLLFGLTVPYVLAFTAVGAAISTLFSTRLRARGAVVAVYPLITQLPHSETTGEVLDVLLNAVPGPGVSAPAINAFRVLSSPLLAVELAMLPGYREYTPVAHHGTGGEEFAVVPWYLQPEIGVVVLIAWIVVPLALGVLVLRRSDLAVGPTIELAVDDPPALDHLRELDGVRSARASEGRITVTCVDPSAKIEVVETVAARATVRNVISTDRTIESSSVGDTS